MGEVEGGAVGFEKPSAHPFIARVGIESVTMREGDG
jgi:hypothetical protein